MIEMMIIAAIVAKVGLDSAGKFAVDVGFGVRGKASPRLAQARARRTPGAASRYWSELWDDAWTDASKRRAAKRADPSRPRGAARVFWSNLWRDGWVAAERKRQARTARPRPETVTVPGTVVPDFQDGPQGEDYGDDQPDEDLDCDETFEDVERQWLFVPDADDRTMPQDGDRTPAPEDEQRNQHHAQQEDDDMTEDERQWAAYEKFLDAHEATHRKYHPSPESPSQEGTAMTATTEIMGLDSAIQFCDQVEQQFTTQVSQHDSNGARTAQVASAYRSLAVVIDNAKAAIANGGVTGVTAEQLAQAQEQANAAAAEMDAATLLFTSAQEKAGLAAKAMETARLELQGHRGIQEQYNANPGAGTREFVTAGQ